MKTTALHDLHVQLGARMTQFEGWEAPLCYTGILDEVETVRQRVGLFDISHMGRLQISGRRSLSLLQRLTTNDVANLQVGRGHYSLMCNPDGGVVDDLTVFRESDETYSLVVNAANTDKDVSWIASQCDSEVRVRDLTDETVLFAIQGPRSTDVLKAASGFDPSGLSRFECAQVNIAGAIRSVCRAGYTGETGYELRTASTDAARVWESLLAVGPSSGIQPCGLGARDVLRLEAGYVLYGHEIDENTSPVAAGLSRFVRINKGEFVGRDALERELQSGPRATLEGVRMEDSSVPRQGARLIGSGIEIGSITSGTFSPTIRRGIGLAYVEAGNLQAGLEVEVMLREKPHRGLIVKPPFI